MEHKQFSYKNPPVKEAILGIIFAEPLLLQEVEKFKDSSFILSIYP